MQAEPLYSRKQDLAEGMAVYSSDGEKLGKVTDLRDDSFTIQKGIFFPKDFTLRYEDIADIRDDTCYLNFDKSGLQDWRSDAYTGWMQTDEINAGELNAVPRDEFSKRYSGWASGDETRIPVSEEELQVQKTQHEKGRVRLRKIVHSEFKHFTVPVLKEEVRVEHVPASELKGDETGLGEGRIEEKTVDIPVMEEEVTVTKRPVLKEEVRVTKERTAEEKQVEGEVKKEEVKIDREDEKAQRRAG